MEKVGPLLEITDFFCWHLVGSEPWPLAGSSEIIRRSIMIRSQYACCGRFPPHLLLSLFLYWGEIYSTVAQWKIFLIRKDSISKKKVPCTPQNLVFRLAGSHFNPISVKSKSFYQTKLTEFDVTWSTTLDEKWVWNFYAT